MIGEAAASYWSRLAGTYDEEADHGLGPDDVRHSWTQRLQEWLPDDVSDVVDLGCGTGSLSVVAAELGHRVTGVDFADAMIERAVEKAEARGVKVRFILGNAAEPPVAADSADVVLVRHVLWALSEPAQAVRRWAHALRPGGRFVLVEGAWSTGAGLAREDVADLLEPVAGSVVVETLDDPALWGHEVVDDRYVVRAVRR